MVSATTYFEMTIVAQGIETEMPLASPAIGNEPVNRMPGEGIGEKSPRGCVRMRLWPACGVGEKT